MFNPLIRFALIALAAIGIYKTVPPVQKSVDYYLNDPKIQTQVIIPATKIANKALPSKFQLPVPTTPAVMGTATDAPISSPLKELTDSISRQAADLASEQVKQIKKTASDQFCQVLIEKIKSECGQ